MPFRYWGNQFRDHWAGDPVYDDFVRKANAINAAYEAAKAAEPELIAESEAKRATPYSEP